MRCSDVKVTAARSILTVVDQLLALARAQASVFIPSTTVSLQHVYRSVLEDLIPLAEVKDIDIGVVGDLDAQLLVNEVSR